MDTEEADLSREPWPKKVSRWRRVAACATGTVVGIGALYLLATWRGLRGTTPVSLRLYLSEWLAVVIIIFGLFLRLHQQGRRLAAFTVLAPEAFELGKEEHAIMRALAVDQFSMSEREIAAVVGLTPNRFRLHWHRLYVELKLVECEEQRPTDSLYSLSQAGRKYAFEHGLI